MRCNIKMNPNLPSQKAGKNPKDMTSMRVSWALKDLIFLKSTPRESEEETIWRVLGMKQLSKEDLKKFPAEYISKLNNGKKK